MTTSTRQFLLSIFAILCLVSSCTSECEKIQKRHAFLIMDLSDKELYKESESDLLENLPNFFARTGIANVSECEGFILSFAHVGAQETLKISSDSIVIPRKGLSRLDMNRLANAEPLKQLIREALAEYNELTNDPEVTRSTTIANVLLKAINDADLESENVYLLFTDGVENNSYLNLYKKIPVTGHSEIIKEIVEPSVLENFRNLQQQGMDAEVIMVLKQEPGHKTDRRKIQAFWMAVFEELNLSYQFVDNLSNKIEL